MKPSLDKIISSTVALGVPGLVLVVAVASSGLAGGAAVVAALAFLGGPFGMRGGMLVLGLLVLISKALTEYGIQPIFKRVLLGLKEKGQTKAQIIEAIDSYPISMDLKLKLRANIDQWWAAG